MFILDYRNGVKQKANSSDFFFLGCNLKNDKIISVCLQGKPFNITVIQVYAPTILLKKLKLNGSMKTYNTFEN